MRHAVLSRKANADKKIGILLSSYPTKHARIGNAVGLDTPASAVRLLRAMREAGYTIGEFPEDGDLLIHSLIAAGGHDVEWLTEDQLATATARVPLRDYEAWFNALPTELREGIREHWGEAPGRLYVDGDEIVLASLTLRQRRADDPAAARVRREPDRHLPRPRPAAEPPLSGRIPLAGDSRSGRTRCCTSASTARWSGCPARASACQRPAPRTPCSASCR